MQNLKGKLFVTHSASDDGWISITSPFERIPIGISRKILCNSCLYFGYSICTIKNYFPNNISVHIGISYTRFLASRPSIDRVQVSWAYSKSTCWLKLMLNNIGSNSWQATLFSLIVCRGRFGVNSD